MNDQREPALPGADIFSFTRAIESLGVRSWSLTGLLVLAVLAALFVARDVVMPLVMALMLSLVFAPLVRVLERVHIPRGLGAGLVVLALVAALATGIYNLSEPAQAWLDKSPRTVKELNLKLRQLAQPVQRVNAATEQVAQISVLKPIPTGDKVQQVVLQPRSLGETLMTAAQGFAVALVSVLVLLYYFLASGDLFLRKVVAVTPRLQERKRAVAISREIEREVSGYLFTVTLINIGLGAIVGLTMWGLGVPNPALWGVMVGLLNFIPYVGDIASCLVLAVVGVLSFDELWRAALVPLSFCFLTALEGYLVTPHVLGRRLRLNPAVIVISVLFWGWMWGIFGALLAVPILVATKTFCARVESLKAFGELLSA